MLSLAVLPTKGICFLLLRSSVPFLMGKSKDNHRETTFLGVPYFETHPYIPVNIITFLTGSTRPATARAPPQHRFPGVSIGAPCVIMLLILFTVPASKENISRGAGLRRPILVGSEGPHSNQLPLVRTTPPAILLPQLRSTLRPLSNVGCVRARFAVPRSQGNGNSVQLGRSCCLNGCGSLAAPQRKLSVGPGGLRSRNVSLGQASEGCFLSDDVSRRSNSSKANLEKTRL